MPTNRKRRRVQERGCPEAVREFLLCGFWFADVFGNPDSEAPPIDELRDTWEDIGDSLLAEHLAESPGSRPWAWWEFDAPEPRKRTTPGGPYTQYIRPAGYGVPANCDPMEFETELAYLKRLGLLTAAELASVEHRWIK